MIPITPMLRGLTRPMIAALIALAAAGCTRQAKVTRHLERAERYKTEGKYEQAELEYLNVLRLDQTNVPAVRSLALMSFDQGSLGRAYSLLAEARKKLPDDFAVRLKLAKCVLAGGAAQQAREEASQLLALQPTDEEALRLLVEASVTADQLTDAAMQLEKLKPVAGETAGYQIAWGLVQLRARELQAAEDSFRKALVTDPKSSAAHLALGNLHMLANRRVEAKAEYKQAAELAPMRSPHRLHYIDVSLGDGDLPEAKRCLEEIGKAAPDFMPAQSRLARMALAEERLDECEQILHRLLNRDPTHLESMLLLGRLLITRDQPAKAVTVLERAKREYPRVAPVHYQLATAYLKSANQVRDAVNSLGEALSLQPDYPDAVMLLAELNLRRGDAAAVITSLSRLVKQRPDLPGAHLMLAFAYLGRGHAREALGIYEKLAEAHPKNPQIPLRAGMLLRQMKRPQDARRSFETALSIDPRYTPALEQLVSLDVAEKKFASARERIEREIAADPAAALPHLLLGKIYFAEGNLLAAEAPLRKSAELATQSGAAHVVLAQVFVAGNRHHDALRTLQDAIARNPADISSWLQIARLNNAAGNHREAAQAYEKIIAVNPQFAPAYNNLAWLCAEHLNELDRALDLANQARRLQPGDPLIADTLGWVYFHKADYARAQPLIRESLERRAEDPQVIFHMGMVHYMMGEETAARAMLLSALQSTAEGAWRTEAESRLRVLDIDPATADDAAVTGLRALAASSPHDPMVATRLAAAAERRGEWREAATNYEKALGANPTLVPALVKLAQLYAVRLNEPARAMEMARQARKFDPGEPIAAHLLGRLTFESAESTADFQRAFGLLQECFRHTPQKIDVLFDYGRAAYAIGQLNDAIPALRKVAEAKPASLWSAQASEHLRLQQLLDSPPDAETNADAIEKLLKAEPNHVPGLMVLGLLQEQKRQFKVAVETYERVLKRYPLFAPANKALALLFFGPARDETKAYQHATRAREALPNDAQVARLLGLLEYDRERYPRAAQLLAESISSLPGDGEVYYRLGIARHKLKQSREGAEALRKGLELAPASPLATYAKLILADLK